MTLTKRKLKRPVRDANGRIRRYKLKKKSTAGIKADRKKISSEYHEKRYQCEKRGGKYVGGRCKRKRR